MPVVLASDAALGVFAMEYLPPADYEPWKMCLARGMVNVSTASAVGAGLASVHAAFAGSAAAGAEFDTGAAFHALRIEPYLLATARVHADVAFVLEDLAERTMRTKTTVVHGDISPKNILIGKRGPVFLDAECAWFGDPAFDLAFCLNHLLLKTLWVPASEARAPGSFDVLANRYLQGVTWEPAGSARGTGGAAVAGTAAGAHRRQVAGRVPDRRGVEGHRAPRRAIHAQEPAEADSMPYAASGPTETSKGSRAIRRRRIGTASNV